MSLFDKIGNQTCLNSGIPLAFGYINDKLKVLSGGPIYGYGVCSDLDKCILSHQGKEELSCIQETMLEIGWSRSNDESIVGHLHQGLYS